MFRRIWTTTVLLATALGFAPATAGPATAGLQANHCEPLVRRSEHAMHRPAKDHAARILVSLGASYFATLLLLIFQP